MMPGKKAVILIGGMIMVVAVLSLCVQKPEEGAPTIQPGKELKLSDFPEVFSESTLIVVGDNASEVEVQAANEIAEYLEDETGNKPLIKKYSEVSEEDKRNYNLIIVGASNSNPMLRKVSEECTRKNFKKLEFKGVNSYWQGTGKGYILILENLWSTSKCMLIVDGYDSSGLESAVSTLLNTDIIMSINNSGILVKLESSTRIQTLPVSKLSKIVAKDIAAEYLIKRCQTIPEDSFKLKVSDFGDYWLIEGGCIKLLVDKNNGFVEEVKS